MKINLLVVVLLASIIVGCTMTKTDGHFEQNEDWVRLNFDSNLAKEINRVGYVKWVDNSVGYDLDNGLYKVVVSVTNDLDRVTEIVIGDKVILARNRTEYVFLCEKGKNYNILVNPPNENIILKATDDLAIEPYNPNDPKARIEAQRKQRQIMKRILDAKRAKLRENKGVRL